MNIQQRLIDEGYDHMVPSSPWTMTVADIMKSVDEEKRCNIWEKLHCIVSSVHKVGFVMDQHFTLEVFAFKDQNLWLANFSGMKESQDENLRRRDIDRLNALYFKAERNA